MIVTYCLAFLKTKELSEGIFQIIITWFDDWIYRAWLTGKGLREINTRYPERCTTVYLHCSLIYRAHQEYFFHLTDGPRYLFIDYNYNIKSTTRNTLQESESKENEYKT